MHAFKISENHLIFDFPLSSSKVHALRCSKRLFLWMKICWSRVGSVCSLTKAFFVSIFLLLLLTCFPINFTVFVSLKTPTLELKSAIKLTNLLRKSHRVEINASGLCHASVVNYVVLNLSFENKDFLPRRMLLERFIERLILSILCRSKQKFSWKRFDWE